MSRTARRVAISGPLVTGAPTGPAVYLTELTRSLLSVRPELKVTYRHATARGSKVNRASAALVDPRVSPRTIPIPNRLLRPLESRLRLPRESSLIGRFDVYHQVHLDDDPAVPSSKLVVTLHDTVAINWPKDEGQISRHAGKLLRRAAAVITVSEYSKREICREFDIAADRVHVVYNGVDHARFKLGLPDTTEVRTFMGSHDIEDGRYLLFAGGSTPRKNVPRIIQALSRLRENEDYKDVRLVLAGPVASASRALMSQLPTNLESEDLIFTGYVPAEVMPHLYARASCLVYPSIQEGFGLPIVEAFACGTPVVTSNRGATAEIAGDRATLVDPTDAQSIAAGIAVQLDAGNVPSDRRRDLSEWAKRFTWDNAARRVLGVYDSLAH